jgi:hypothetical protein
MVCPNVLWYRSTKKALLVGKQGLEMGLEKACLSKSGSPDHARCQRPYKTAMPVIMIRR